jgi:flagellin
MIINHNISALFSSRQLFETGMQLDKSMEKLSSGMRINRAGDDASGLAVSEKMRSQIRGLLQAQRNAQDGISWIQTAEGALTEVHNVLHRQRELAIQAANGIYTIQDRDMIDVEVRQLTDEINRIATQTRFNTQIMLTGGFAEGGQHGVLKLHVGAMRDERITVSVSSMTAQALGVEGVSISNPDLANDLLGKVDNAVITVAKQRADLGALQNRLESTIRNLGVAAENIQAAESRIRDADMAKEMVNYVRTQILTRSGTAMLAQANLKSQSVLSLLG